MIGNTLRMVAVGAEVWWRAPWSIPRTATMLLLGVAAVIAWSLPNSADVPTWIRLLSVVVGLSVLLAGPDLSRPLSPHHAALPVREAWSIRADHAGRMLPAVLAGLGLCVLLDLTLPRWWSATPSGPAGTLWGLATLPWSHHVRLDDAGAVVSAGWPTTTAGLAVAAFALLYHHGAAERRMIASSAGLGLAMIACWRWPPQDPSSATALAIGLSAAMVLVRSGPQVPIPTTMGRRADPWTARRGRTGWPLVIREALATWTLRPMAPARQLGLGLLAPTLAVLAVWGPTGLVAAMAAAVTLAILLAPLTWLASGIAPVMPGLPLTRRHTLAMILGSAAPFGVVLGLGNGLLLTAHELEPIAPMLLRLLALLCVDLVNEALTTALDSTEGARVLRPLVALDSVGVMLVPLAALALPAAPSPLATLALTTPLSLLLTGVLVTRALRGDP